MKKAVHHRLPFAIRAKDPLRSSRRGAPMTCGAAYINV
jgi:hypothetical protein